MKISEMIEVLEKIKEEHGDIPCLIEYLDEDMAYLFTELIGECSVENRPGFGWSVKFLI